MKQVTRELRWGAGHTNAFGYHQNGCRPQPTRDSALCPHVRMGKCIRRQKFRPRSRENGKEIPSSAGTSRKMRPMANSGRMTTLSGRYLTDLRAAMSATKLCTKCGSCCERVSTLHNIENDDTYEGYRCVDCRFIEWLSRTERSDEPVRSNMQRRSTR